MNTKEKGNFPLFGVKGMGGGWSFCGAWRWDFHVLVGGLGISYRLTLIHFRWSVVFIWVFLVCAGQDGDSGLYIDRGEGIELHNSPLLVEGVQHVHVRYRWVYNTINIRDGEYEVQDQFLTIVHIWFEIISSTYSTFMNIVQICFVYFQILNLHLWR